jgi:hypothetical protein
MLLGFGLEILGLVQFFVDRPWCLCDLEGVFYAMRQELVLVSRYPCLCDRPTAYFAMPGLYAGLLAIARYEMPPPGRYRFCVQISEQPFLP